MTEIEVKLKYKNKARVVSLIKKLGFFLKKTRKIKDVYFGKSHSSMSNKNQLLRIRDVESEYTELTLKDELKDAGGVWTRRELNVPILDADKMGVFLKALGYEKLRENSSDREIWENNRVEIEFISYTLPSKLEFIEIESGDKNSIDKLVNYLGNEVSVAGEELFSAFDKTG